MVLTIIYLAIVAIVIVMLILHMFKQTTTIWDKIIIGISLIMLILRLLLIK